MTFSRFKLDQRFDARGTEDAARSNPPAMKELEQPMQQKQLGQWSNSTNFSFEAVPAEPAVPAAPFFKTLDLINPLPVTKTRIAIIEDNKVIRDSVTRFIRFHEEFDVVESVGSVESFMHRLQIDPRIKTDILLLDIGLPGVSGLDGIPMILEKMPDVDIIMLTSYEEEDVILRAICSGACSYLSKKASLEEIVEAIRIVVKGGSYMSPSVAREIVQHLMGGRVSKATILTDRQKEILEKLVEGKSYGSIALELFISVETVRTHVKAMYKVLHVNSKAEAIAKYLRGEIK